MGYWQHKSLGSAKRPENGLHEVECYWEQLSQRSGIPKRTDFDPGHIMHALSQVFVIERIAPRLARFRVAGSGVSALIGHELRGMPVSSIISPDSRDEFGLMLASVFDGPSRAEFTLSGGKTFGSHEVSATVTLLPLANDRGVCDGAVGYFDWQGRFRRGPKRFSMMSSYSRQIRGFKANKARAAYQELACIGRETRAPHLKLVVGGKT